jgi:hypothetical protein
VGADRVWGDRGYPWGLYPPSLQNGDLTPPPRTTRAAPESFPWLEQCTPARQPPHVRALADRIAQRAGDDKGMGGKNSNARPEGDSRVTCRIRLLAYLTLEVFF